MCGRLEMPDWELLPDLVQLVFRRELPPFILPNHMENDSLAECLYVMMRLRLSTLHGRRCSLFPLLQLLHPLRTTDPRDKVYSVLGLASDEDRASVPIDYDISPEQLYISVAKYLVLAGDGINLIVSNAQQKTLKLPSWVPDWSTWQYGHNGTLLSAGYTASGYTKAVMELQGDTQLRVSGSLISKIVRLGTNIGDHYSSSTASDELSTNLHWGQWLQGQLEMVQQLCSYPDGHSAPVDVLWRTLIGNITFDERAAESDYRAYYEAHVRLGEQSSAAEKRMAREFYNATRRRSRYRRLAVTASGHLCAVPQIGDVGDWLCLFHGAEHLFLVRSRGKDFVYLGHAYAHGLMNGEGLRTEGVKAGSITLV